MPQPRNVRVPAPALGALLACLAGVPAQAQEAGRALALTPQFAASGIYTETRNSLKGENGTEFTTRLSPGLMLNSRSGRVQGSLNYTLNALFRSGSDEAREIQNSLAAAFTAEAIERWLFIDARSTISQQSISAYGQQTLGDSARANANRAEVGTASLSPYVRGMLGPSVNYEVRLDASINETKGTSESDATTLGGSVSLASAGQARLGWALALTQQSVNYKTGRETANERANLTLNYRPDPDLQLNLSGGQETTDVLAQDSQSYGNWGLGARWTPTERTSLRLQSDRRYFGRSHAYAFEHRMARSSIAYSDTRDSSGGTGPRGVGQPITLYQQLYAQFGPAQPDPVLRDQMVLDQLRLLGRDRNEIVQGGLLNSAVSLQRRQDLSLTWTGLRMSFNVQGFASRTRVLDTLGGNPDTGNTRLFGYTGTLSYKLTPSASVNFIGSRQATAANDVQVGNVLKSVSLGFTAQPGRLISTSLLARYAVFNSTTDPYRETSVTGTLNLRF